MLGHLLICCGDDASISIGAQVLGGIKTERRGYAKRTRPAPAPLSANRLRGVLHNRDVSIYCSIHFSNYAVERIHVGALSVEMYGKNRAKIRNSPGANRLIDQCRIQIQGSGIDIHKNRRCARPDNRTGGSKKTEW